MVQPLADDAWRDRYLVFGAPRSERPSEERSLRAWHSGWLGSGPRVAELEGKLAAYLDAPFVVAVNSGTAALHLALRVLDLPARSEVLVPALTFCATANAVVHAGHAPVFVDVDRRTGNIDLDDARRRITPRTRAIVPVHFAGPALRDGGALAARRRSMTWPSSRMRRTRWSRPSTDATAARWGLRLLQLLRHQEPDHRRGRAGRRARSSARPTGSGCWRSTA